MSAPLTVSVLGVGLLGPGLPGWRAGRAHLAAGAPPAPAEALAIPPATLLPPNERRRAGPTVRLALAVAAEAAAEAGADPAALRTVFGTSNGEGLALGAILEAFARGETTISPTLFHNSVHNTAAAHWSMAAGSPMPSTSLGAHDGTFAATLLKAASEAVAEDAPVLMCVLDVPLAPPLDAVRPMDAPFAAALVLGPSARAGLARLEVRWSADPPRPPPVAPWRNQSAFALALLRPLAASLPGASVFPLSGGALHARIVPCSTAPPSRA